jgi:hypothetical protein
MAFTQLTRSLVAKLVGRLELVGTALDSGPQLEGGNVISIKLGRQEKAL